MAASPRSERPPGASPAPELATWFVGEVLPLEGALTRYLARRWRCRQDIADLRQDIYARLLAAAGAAAPDNVRAFLFAVARNHLANVARRTRLVSIESVPDPDALPAAQDPGGAERGLVARDELRRLQLGLARLPPRCRQVVLLRRVGGLSQREVAARLGVTTDTVERQMVLGMRALTDFMAGGSGRIDRACPARQCVRAMH